MRRGQAATRRVRVLSSHLGAGAAAEPPSPPPPPSFAAPTQLGIDPEPLERLKAIVHAHVDAGKWPHAVTLVARRGKICMLDVYNGKDETEAGDLPLNVRTSIFRLYSQTKPIIAATAMALVDRGKLRIDDPISRYLPEFAEAEKRWGGSWPVQELLTEGPDAKVRPASHPPTVRHLLMHSAGIFSNDIEDVVQAALNTPAYKEAEPSERLRIFCTALSELPLMHDPGNDFLYAIQFDVLGRVLEEAGGGSLEQVVKELICEPCGMDSTFFRVPRPRWGDLRKCYELDRSVRPPVTFLEDRTERMNYFKNYTVDSLGYFGGSEGMVSTVADFYNFASMLLNGGVCPATGRQVLSEAAVLEMTSNQVPGGGNMSSMRSASRMGLKRSGFGLGVSVALEPSSDRGEPYSSLGCGVGEYGWGGAADTHYFASPKDGGLLVLFFTQVVGDPTSRVISKAFHRYVYQSVVEPQ